jgi:hypothetical protein
MLHRNIRLLVNALGAFVVVVTALYAALLR